jgi:general secretion pathway protein F
VAQIERRFLARLSGTATGAIMLDDLIALNDEIIALARAGVPLEQGLGELGRDLPGRLGAISSELAASMERGESLEQVLGQVKHGFPPVYRAVAGAGLRAGRLPAALESVARSVRRLAELRRMVSLAMLYPLLVFLLAYGLFVFMVAVVVPILVGADWTGTAGTMLGWLARSSESIRFWGPIAPVVVIGLAAVWWHRSRHAALVQSPLAARYLGWIPSLRSVLANSRAGAFCEVLAVLLEHGVPLGEALRLAGEASGDARIEGTAEEMAARAESGQTFMRRDLDERNFAPLVSWLLLAGQSQTQLVQSMRFAADSYERRAVRQAEWLSLYLPLILTALIGGLVTFLYATTLFVPWSMMMSEFAAP